MEQYLSSASTLTRHRGVTMNIWEYFFADPMTELYAFQHGGQVFYYAATSERAIPYNGNTYTPEYVWRSQLHYSSDFAKDTLSITLSAENPVARLFLDGSPEHLVKLTIYRGGYHAKDFAPVWIGTVNGANFSFSADAYSCELSCETHVSRMERRGLVRCYQLTCPFSLYDRHCSVDMAQYAKPATVLQTLGHKIELNISLTDNYYVAGQSAHPSGRRRFIVANTGQWITTDRPLGAAAGDLIILYPGCDKTRTACTEKFNNFVNFGGFPWLPIEDPFRTSIG